ncbi:molybdate ABC transporter substrate-binding protein [Delftia acidovorans]|uniref:molybdate ABC transporter substrate-binding protein n=1 Tax=Delftia acidovorans TaxID=80866 RepID=UPI00241ECE9B|nr:molybdate ABC transporter substrate-binding protein [Delftia acidovorans]
MFKRILSRGLAPLLVLLLAGSASLAHADEGLLLAAGAGYRKPVLELLQAFSQATGIRAEASFGNMKQIETQARQNPEIAVLIGDRAFVEPMQLAERYITLGQGQLVLVAARGQRLESVQDLARPEFKRIADRSKAVYGNAARICLERLGLAQTLGERLVEVATVPQVSAYVTTGEVDAGFVNKTEALALKDRVGASVPVAASCHPPIELSLAVLKGRASSPQLQALLDFIATPQARQVLERHGL